MSIRRPLPARGLGQGTIVAVVALTLLLIGQSASYAQIANNGVLQRSVGGIAIDTQGVLSNATVDAVGELHQVRSKAMQQVPDDLQRPAALRKVSLARLDTAIRKQLDAGKPLPDAMQYLSGLQRIDYVLVYPEQHDVVLVGPAEGWKIDRRGNVIGATSGRPVMLLDDLLVAVRTAQQAAQGGISCSIDPSAEGLARLRGTVGKMHTIGNPQNTLTAIEQSLGQQQITVQGVPATSHFARVLVAADYRMKRLAMNFEPAPIPGLPGFLTMMQASGHGMSNMLPRWWLAPQYEPLVRDPEGLAWQLQLSNVKALTEEDFLNAGGAREHTGRAHPVAQKWADQMTAKYAELAVADPIFGQLRNCMELAIVGALLAKERLLERAGASLPTLMDAAAVPASEFPAPRQVSTQASALKKGKNWVISASGGVQIPSWQALHESRTDPAPAGVRSKSATADPNAWWWN